MRRLLTVSALPAGPLAVLLLVALGGVSLLAPVSDLAAATTIYRHRAADGTFVFSDSPVIGERFERRSYGGDHRREPATAACRNLGRRGLETRAERWRGMATHAATRHGLDPELVLAVARIESCFDPFAVSRAGAQGLMQLMPGTARELGVADPFDAAANLDAGSRYLARMLALFGGDLSLALAAYNAGPGNVRRHGGVPPFPETRRYIERVTRLYSPRRDPAGGEGTL